ncbi:MAG: 2,3-bisphosphoglycerate-independent phosphoglycerate mutase [Alphaproteobacteria bacterium]|nr:2,3-bisphosphoglycerate-independent phosphoglycerate mutase [Alphaproteobacteria bacterium]
MKKPLILCILDGIGIAPASEHNALWRANTPFYNSLLEKYPHTQLAADGGAVGLLPGTMGNSEVGHIAIGAGRIVNQFIQRFALAEPTMEDNPALQKFIANLKSSGGRAHILGLASDGRVHSDLNHAIFLAKILQKNGIPMVWHFVADGRDTPPQSAEKYINMIRKEFPGMTFGSISGRYYTMDRNENWDRTELAFNAIAHESAEFTAPDIDTALRDAYARGETDEFIRPTIVTRYPLSVIRNDGLLFFNYRSDRARQILRLFTDNESRITDNVLCLSQYGGELNDVCPALLPDVKIDNTLGDVLAAAGKSQLRLAETEKYNHITYFFDGERMIDYPGEEKILIPSPAVATFDLAPEMSAIEITDTLIPRINDFDVIIVNYANGDMVGHTGDMGATIKALETLDVCLSRLVPAAIDAGGTIIITSDHGNAEDMWDAENNTARTAHTTNPVPFIIVNRGSGFGVRGSGGLADIAPTMLDILGIEKPSEMTGESLLSEKVKE